MVISGAGNSLNNYYGMTNQNNDKVKAGDAANTKSKSSSDYVNSENKTDDKDSFSKMVEEYGQKVKEIIKNGGAEPTYQIGGQSFTEKEWKKLIKKTDKAIDSIKKEQKEREEAILQKIKGRDTVSVNHKTVQDAKHINDELL